jgi:transcriptional regulator with XRE-family HTH domain
VSAELRAMRLKRELKQAALAKRAKTGQSAISRIERQNYNGWTYQTLLNIALALDARLSIKLEPIEDVIRRMRSHEEHDEENNKIESVGGTTEFAEIESAPPPMSSDLIDADGTADATRVM